MAEFKDNSFLSCLLSLQQDGSGAISAPTNWNEPPLLDVTTELDEVVEQIAPALLSKSNTNKVGVWWFLVGSPGNGKSAAVGRLVRTLANQQHASFHVEKADSGELGPKITELHGRNIPYKVDLYEAGNRFASAWFAQDASVVRNPFAEDADPAKELIGLVQGANRKGVSLVVCANRGVLEKACEVAGRDPDVKRSAWYRALKAASIGEETKDLQLELTTRKPVFKSVNVRVTSLDAHSLLLAGTFRKLAVKAVADENWKVCEACAAQQLCPFKQNRDWLSHHAGISRLETVMRVSELYSGQIIVFREAVALISLLLAGCTKDYKNRSPCEYVRDQVEKEAFFTLLSRRVYLVLFSSNSPFGLEFHDGDQSEQLDAINELAQPPRVSESATRVVSRLTSPEHQPSPDVGLTRLLGIEGVLCQLDPLKEGQPRELENKWDATAAELATRDDQLISNLETRCFAVWAELERALENYGDQTIIAYKWLRRWITSISYRMGFFAEGALMFERELVALDRTINAANQEDPARNAQHLANISEQLGKMLAITEEGIEIGPFVSITGQWVRSAMRVSISGHGSRSGGLEASVGTWPLDLSANVYSWLDRKVRTGLQKETFPDEVLQVAEDIRRRAATGSGYAFEDDDVRLRIMLPEDKRVITIRRFGEHAVIDHDSD